MKQLIFLLIVSGFVFGLSSCKLDDNDPYHIQVMRARFSKDSFFKSGNESPMDPKGKRELIALDYYAPDIKYKVIGHLELLDSPKSYRMQVSNSAPEQYYNMGNVVFTVNGHEGRLAVYQNAKAMKDPRATNELFCPFTDETNGKGTYKAGRFLDLHLVPNTKDIDMDFNLAYNPYCAYNHEYSCPIPPEQNHLVFMIEAGEKSYQTGRFSFFK
jgi:uncharacterized protein (DUF1684 family)